MASLPAFLVVVEVRGQQQIGGRAQIVDAGVGCRVQARLLLLVADGP